jgi:periodic tryptophan protein 2
VSFRPDGKVVACSTLDAQIILIDINEDDQHAVIGNIECKHDVGYSRKDSDKITAKKSQFGK